MHASFNRRLKRVRFKITRLELLNMAVFIFSNNYLHISWEDQQNNDMITVTCGKTMPLRQSIHNAHIFCSIA